MIVHPNPTVGYRVQERGVAMTYLPDHEPALGCQTFPRKGEWTSGYALAEGVDLLIHDSQYSDELYRSRVGFGHSSLTHALRFAQLAEVGGFVPFHHDPAHSDEQIDQMIEQARYQHCLQPLSRRRTIGVHPIADVGAALSQAILRLRIQPRAHGKQK